MVEEKNKKLEEKQQKETEEKKIESEKNFGEKLKIYLLAILVVLVIGFSIVSYMLYNIGERISKIQVSSDPFKVYLDSLQTVPLPEIRSVDIVLGNNKDYILYEFTDLQCPFCMRWELETYPAIYNDYIKTGKISFVVKHFPLFSIHPLANVSAQYLGCIAKYYGSEKAKAFESIVYENFTEWQKGNATQYFNKYVESLGLDVNKIENCVNTSEVYKDILNDYYETTQVYRFSGTPSFLIAAKLDKLKYENVKQVENILNQLRRYGLDYQILLSNDTQYLLIGFSGALPYEYFDQLFKALNI